MVRISGSIIYNETPDRHALYNLSC